jgi:hypothetical protein
MADRGEEDFAGSRMEQQDGGMDEGEGSPSLEEQAQDVGMQG